MVDRSDKVALAEDTAKGWDPAHSTTIVAAFVNLFIMLILPLSKVEVACLDIIYIYLF